MGELLRHAITIAKKDLEVELRTKEILLTMGFFGLLSVLVLAFAFRRGDAPLAPVASGSLWVAIAFSGTVGLSRAFDREREGDSIRALLLTPIPRTAIYIGKAVGIALFMLLTELVIVPAVLLFFNAPIDLERIGMLLVLAVLGTSGYAIVGTLLAASLMKASSRDVLLSVVLFPVIVPVIIAGAMGTNALFETTVSWPDLTLWTRVLIAFDAVFLVASLWIFEPLILD
ncbi:MAG: heme exporter protein CcmB [Myxococcota bacterium]